MGPAKKTNMQTIIQQPYTWTMITFKITFLIIDTVSQKFSTVVVVPHKYHCCIWVFDDPSKMAVCEWLYRMNLFWVYFSEMDKFSQLKILKCFWEYYKIKIHTSLDYDLSRKTTVVVGSRPSLSLSNLQQEGDMKRAVKESLVINFKNQTCTRFAEILTKANIYVCIMLLISETVPPEQRIEETRRGSRESLLFSSDNNNVYIINAYIF